MAAIRIKKRRKAKARVKAAQRVKAAALPARSQPSGMGVEVIARRQVDNPLMTAALLEHQLEHQLGAPGPLPPGKIEVEVKLTELIGGMARIGRRTQLQELAAARYRVLFDQAQIGGARAIDYSAVRVDVSGAPAGLVFEVGEEARQAYRRAVQRLGMIGSSRFEKVVCHNMSVRQLQQLIGEAAGHAGWDRTAALLLGMAEELAELFQFKLVARGGQGLRSDGAAPTQIDEALIINRVRSRAA